MALQDQINTLVKSKKYTGGLESKQVQVSKSATARVWILPLLVGLVIVGGVMFAIKPWIEDILKKQDLIVSKEKTISRVLPKLDLLARQDEGVLREYLVALQLSVPSQIVPPAILDIVENLLRQEGLNVESIHYEGIANIAQTTITQLGEDTLSGVVVPEPTIVPTLEDINSQTSASAAYSGDIGLQVAVSGDYFQIVNFLKRLQETRPLLFGSDLTVNNLKILGVVDGDGADIVGSSLVLTASAPFQTLINNLGEEGVGLKPISPSDVALINELQKRETLITSQQITDNVDTTYPQGKDNPF